MIKNLSAYEKVRDIDYSVQDLKDFELDIVEHWEAGKIHGPVHLSHGNEQQLIEIFQCISKQDWVFSTWRSHYHALLKGVPPDQVKSDILAGNSITLSNVEHNFTSSAIVGGCLSIALGLALGLKETGSKDRVWCFIGDMCFESGLFYETHKYARNFNLPLHFIVEDNGVATNTPTKETWNGKRDIPDDVIYYTYESKYPHYGTGKWVIF